MTQRLKTMTDGWFVTCGLDDAKVAQRIREDRIDILVDLTQHMADNRLLVFARKPAPVQVAWLQHDVPQCGYCQSGQIMAAAALLREKPKPTETDVGVAITNICRCGTYQRIKAAIDTAAALNAASPVSGKV